MYNYIKTILLCFGLLITGLYLYGQVVPHTRYSSKHGLIADRISTISQDSRGMMWFGSYYGISRYDGISFETMRLPAEQQQKYVTSMVPAGDRVFAGFSFSGGVAQFDKGTVKPLPLRLNNRSVYSDVSALAAGEDDAPIIASSGKIYEYRDGTIHLLYDLTPVYSKHEPPKALLKVKGNTICVGTAQGLYILEKKGDHYVLAQHVLKECDIFSLYKSPDGLIWIEAGDKEGTIIGTCRGDFRSFRVLLKKGGLWAVPFNSKVSTSVWGFDIQNGLFNITSGGKLTYYPKVIHTNTDVSYIYADRENNIWVANDPGVIKITLQNAQTYLFNEMAAAGGHMEVLRNGSILASNAKHLYLIGQQQIKKVREFRSGENAGYLGAFIESNEGDIWSNRWQSGLWRLRLNEETVIDNNFIHAYNNREINVTAFAKDSTAIWAGGVNHLYHIRHHKIVEEVHLQKLLNTTFHVTGIAIDKENKRMFLADNNAGIYQLGYKENGTGPISLWIEKHITVNEGISDPNIRSLLLDSRGTLWAGTRFGGIYKIEIKGTKYTITNYNSSNGFPCTRVTGIAEEPGKSLWFATCDGLQRYFFSNGQWEHYDVANGLPSAEVFDVLVDTSHQQVLALTSGGVTAIKYNEKVPKAPPPLISLTGIYVLDEPDTAALYSKESARYPSSKNSIRFTFSGSSFLDEKKVVYKYLLKGHSDTWSEPTTSNSVTFASLPPGEYTFEVIAANSQGTWAQQPALFSFRVVQPFYKSYWFLTGILLALAFLFYAVQNYRLKQKVRIQKLRLNIARDLHDDIGSALGSINLLSRSATRKLEKAASSEEIMGTFERIGDSAQTTLESMDDIIWSINPDKDHWQDLLIRMKEFALPVIESRNINLVIENHVENLDKLSMQVRRTLFMVFKECITNCVKHAHCSAITVVCSVHQGALQLTIQDNGKGFDVTKTTSRNGIKNMLQRATILKGTVTIQSALNSGTTVTFQCPLR